MQPNQKLKEKKQQQKIKQQEKQTLKIKKKYII